MPDQVALDTTVLRRANVTLTGDRAEANLMARRIDLLKRIHAKKACLLVSPTLVAEYMAQVMPPRNDFVRTTLELATKPDGQHIVANWKQSWSGGERGRARDCRYPEEDDHVLRTAIHDKTTTIYSEETRMVDADQCIYRKFRVHIRTP